MSTQSPVVPLQPVGQEAFQQAVKDTIAKPARKASIMPWRDVTVCIGQVDVKGVRQETVHRIDVEDGDIRIVGVEHKVAEKQRQCKEDGQLVGFEPTGEYELTIKVKYVKD